MVVFLAFFLGSVLISFIGGLIPVNKQVFWFLLGLSLVFVGIRILFFPKENYAEYKKKDVSFLKRFFVGGGIGLISGMIGIGGGIFLAPLLYIFRWANPKQIAASTAMFVLLNSLSGLAGHLVRHSEHFQLKEYIPLFIAVLVGGQFGSFLSARKLSHYWVEKCTALLVLFVGIRSLMKLFL